MCCHVRKIIGLCLLAVISTSCIYAAGDRESAIPGQPGMAILDETTDSIRFREFDGTIVVIPKNPQRTIITLNSMLDVWYMAGGTALARLRGSINVPEEAVDLPILGTTGSLNAEKILSLEPDLVIVSAASDHHQKIKALLAAEGINTLALTYRNYEDFLVLIDLFTRLTGRRDIFEEQGRTIEYRVQSIIDQVPEGDPPLVCILFASTRYVRVETGESLSGYFCKCLGAENICADMAPGGSTRIDLSLEYILQKDPDVIFITTMGDITECRERLEMDIISSSIWADLSAVQNGRLFYLDPTYSLYRPNRSYPEAFMTIAGYLYPDIEFVLPHE